ncbi:MAG: ribbon-helix-helix domain-containing protein [Candidatus Methanomethylophilus sp.]|jgi:Arc/MetJ-type ribon-helix-helix transcriptional regulator|nr:ribbon-helix-helix domain-containing protein [Methanomethylophilus sp.]MCI2092513.1 ribbon-helix-helix domain-containing protein [Methanomethylophilus sp.]
MNPENKVKINITLRPDNLEWIDKEVKSMRFGSRSHGIDAAVFWYRKYLEEGELPPR